MNPTLCLPRARITIELPETAKVALFARMGVNGWTCSGNDSWENTRHFPGQRFSEAEAIGAELERFFDPINSTASTRGVLTEEDFYAIKTAESIVGPAARSEVLFPVFQMVRKLAAMGYRILLDMPGEGFVVVDFTGEAVDTSGWTGEIWRIVSDLEQMTTN